MKLFTLAVMLGSAPLAAQMENFDYLLPAPDAQTWTPVTQRDRFKYYVASTFSVGTLAGAAASAGFKQLANEPQEWRQGAGGYGKRTGDALAKSGTRLTIRYMMAAALHEDNRYIAAPSITMRGRLWYAVTSTYAARDQQGHRRFAISKFVGNAGGAALSRYWEPQSRQGVSRMGTDFALISAVQAGLNVASEFTPGLLRRLRGH